MNPKSINKSIVEAAMPSEGTDHTSSRDARHSEETAQANDTDLDQEKSQTPSNPASRVLSTILTRTISRTSATTDPGPPPDGGLQAWLQVLSGHLITFNLWGYISSYGVFQSYYVAALQRPPSDISWVGSIQLWLLFFTGAFSGRATDAGYFKFAYVAGSLLFLLGVFMTSLCTRYWQFFLAQGLCQGIGIGLIFCPLTALLATYFSRHRALAMAAVASGTSTGGLVYPAMVERLLPTIGFAWTVRAIGFVMLIIQIVGLFLTRPRLPPRKSGPLIEWAAFREPTYAFFTAELFLIFWGLFFAFYYVSSYAKDIIHVSSADSTNLLLLMNGIGIPGRLFPAYFADAYTGPLNLFIISAFGAGILVYCWIGVSSHSGMYAFCAVYGFCSATILGLFPSTLSSLTGDPRKQGVRMGMVFGIVGFACLSGPPIAGALVQRAGGGYLYAQAFAGTVIFVGCGLVLTARIAKTGTKIWAKV